MCGASSLDDGIEAATYILTYMKKIQDIMNRIHDDSEKTSEIYQWVKTQTKGDYIEKIISESRLFNNVTLQVFRPVIDNVIVYPSEKIPEHMDEEIVRFLVSMADDFLYHQDFCKKIDYILRFHEIVDEPLEILHVTEVMVNYNFSLGFEVDRLLLNEAIDGQEGFVSRYNNALSTSVTIELPYEYPETRMIKSRANKKPKHTFLVYRSGSITFSSSSMSLMKPIYEKFRRLINELRPYIEYRGNNQNSNNTIIKNPKVELLEAEENVTSILPDEIPVNIE